MPPHWGNWVSDSMPSRLRWPDSCSVFIANNALAHGDGIVRKLTVFVLGLLLAGSVFARGHSAGSSGTVSVRGYTRADGTHVSAYTREAPGSRSTASSSAYGGASPIDDDVNWSEGMGRKPVSSPKTVGCVYSDVMTDDQIAACKQP